MARVPDYFDQNCVCDVTSLSNHALTHYIYPQFTTLPWPQDTVFALNLQWPTQWCRLPQGHSLYVLTFHLEQMDVEFVKQTAQNNPNSTVMVLTDNDVPHSAWWPSNCVFFSWITWHQQLEQIVKLYGMATVPNQPNRLLSSLCFRTDQFKHYVTGYLLQHADLDQCMISYHGYHQHRYFFDPTGRPELDRVLAYMDHTQPHLVVDQFDATKNYPMANCDWRVPAYTDCAVNFTNEGFHYSYTVKDGMDFYWPGPYVTEKTWKPLLAGCAMISVGQANIYRYLEDLGLRFDYGLDLSHDQNLRDLDRLQQIFRLIDQIVPMSATELSNACCASTQHNLDWISSGKFSKQCELRNQQSFAQIQAKLIDIVN
jgi:hypothetical protein